MSRRKPDKPKKAKAITAKRVQATEDEKAPQVGTVDIHPEPDEEPWGEDCLTPKQRAFVEAYVGPAASNGTRAAEMAGYNGSNRDSLKSTACENLTKPYIQRALARALAEKRRVSREWVLAGLVELAGGSMADFIAVNANGETSVDMVKALEAGAIGAVKEIREEVLKSSGTVVVLKRTLKLYDRRAALETLAEILGMKSGEPQVPERQVQRRAMRIGDENDADNN